MSYSKIRKFLIADQTGVGQPVIDLLRQKIYPVIGVTITSGDKVTTEDPRLLSWRVPKKN